MEIIPTCLELCVSYDWWAKASKPFLERNAVSFWHFSGFSCNNCVYTRRGTYSGPHSGPECVTFMDVCSVIVFTYLDVSTRLECDTTRFRRRVPLSTNDLDISFVLKLLVATGCVCVAEVRMQSDSWVIASDDAFNFSVILYFERVSPTHLCK